MTNLVYQFLSAFWSAVGWRDVLDVVIVSIFLYQVFKLIRGTQAIQLLMGLAFLVAMSFIANLLHLRLLEFLVNNGSQALVIAVVVLFQPELRRALDQVGRLGMIRWHPGTTRSRQMLAHVAIAVGHCSEERRGALIVIERETGLEQIAITGVRIDSEVTADLLETIFYVGSPLHDGAIVIRGERILSAACVLPLADTASIPRRLGTRHRAALGLTMQCDALVVVVSEETGTISVATDGRLETPIAASALLETLAAELGADDPHSGHHMAHRSKAVPASVSKSVHKPVGRA